MTQSQDHVAVFDKQRLLDVVDGGDPFVQEMVHEFRLMMVEKFDKMVKYLLEEEYARIEHEAHSIKGAASVMGADRILDVARDLEIAAQNEQSTAIEIRMGELRSEYGEFLREAGVD